MKVGDLVLVDGDDGWAFWVESIDPPFCDVRAMTPDRKPSCCVTMTYIDKCTVVEDVVTDPKSDEWWAESRAFCAAIERLLDDESGEEDK